MDRYKMPDGIIVRPSNAVITWEGDTTHFDGNNHVSVHTGSQGRNQNLYKTKTGRYWLEHKSQWQGERSHAEWVSEKEAAAWLCFNNDALPEDLEQFREETEE